jgi:uncharacterized protein (DUF433 family)
MAMEMVAMDWHDQITVDPHIQGGKPVLKGRRLPVQVIVGSLAGGMSVEEICEEYRVTEDQVRVCLRYAAEVLADQRVVAVG